MTSATFKLSSDGGSTYGSPGVAFADATALPYVASGNYAIRAALDSTVGVSSVSWTITSADDAHVASLPTVTVTNKIAAFNVPKQGGTWLLRCVVNGGVNLQTGDADPALTASLAIKVRNSVGQQEIAVGETTQAGSYGYTKAWNDLARSIPTGVAATGEVIFCDDGSIAGSTVLTDFGDAFTAAETLPGRVTLQIVGATATIPAGTYDLDGRISLVGVPPAGTDKVDVTVALGATLQKPVEMTNMAVTTEGSSVAIQVEDGTTLVLDNTSVQANGTAEAIGFSTGGTVVMRNDSMTVADTSEAFVVGAGETVNIVVEDTSTIAQNTIVADVTSTVNLTPLSPQSTIASQSGIAGTLVQDTALDPWVFTLTGCYGDPDELPADLDAPAIAPEACRLVRAVLFRQVAGALGSTTVQLKKNGSTNMLTSGLSVAYIDGDAADAQATAAAFSVTALAANDWVLPVLTAAEDYTAGPPEGPSTIVLTVYRVKA